MINLATGALLKAASALTAAAASTALVATPAQAAPLAPATASAATAQVTDFPAFDPHRRGYRAHFRTFAQCQFFANHDRNPRTNGWDCRHGGDRSFPWEYWY